MKNFIYLSVLFVVAMPVAAYQVGTANRTNFGSGQVPGQAAQQNYRSFSNYNNRSWGQGVQTQTVQTEVAGTSAVDFDKNTPKQLVSKTQAATPKAANTAQPTAAPAPVQASTAPAAMPANVDPAAMMQQVQGMMSAMGNMTGGAAQQGQSGQAVAMPAGMPDISALMGGAMPTAPAAPAKK
ncbi:MAG: hypothetical protein IJ876_00095 [Elusimicrobiaceae bacterium]|nr:hypothetical protein [Elusimicrobiaceae bacterium]